MKLSNQFYVYMFAALALGGCASGTTQYVNVVTGVDANGQPTIVQQEYKVPRTFVTTSTESLSSGPCLNSKCR